MTRIFIYYLLLDVVFSRCIWLDEGYSIATDINLMKHSQSRLDSIVASCLHSHRPVSSIQYKQLRNCYIKYFSSCMIKTHKSPTSSVMNQFKLCGMIYMSREQNVGNQWITMRVFSSEYVAINVILFDLAWGGKYCRQHGMMIHFFGKEDVMKSHRFCGRRLPWNMLYKRSEVTMMLYGPSVLLHTSTIYLHYWSQFTSSLTPFNVVHCERQAVVKSPPFTMKLHDAHYRVVMYVNVLSKIRVIICFGSSKSDLSADHVSVYDGPGSKSTLIFSGFRRGTCDLPIISTGSMLTMFYHQVYSMIRVKLDNIPTDINKISVAEKNTTIFSVSSQYSNKLTLVSVFGTDGSGHISKMGRGTSTSRHIFTIKQVVFTGPSNLDTGGSTSCQYGGLFIYKKINHTYFPEMEICDDQMESAVPVILSEDYVAWIVAILWFAGYTEGHISGQVQETGCTQHILQPPIIHNFKFKLDPSVECASFYTSGQNSTVTINIRRTTGEILGPLDFHIITGLFDGNINPVLFSSITCVDSDNITKHSREGVTTKSRTLFPFKHSVTLSYCVLHITPLVLVYKHFFTLEIKRHVCKQWHIGAHAPNIYLDPRHGDCDTKYEIGKLPTFHIVSRRGEAYNVVVHVSNTCHRYPTIKVVDTREDMSHVYTVKYGSHRQGFLLTRARIEIEPAILSDIRCGENVEAYLRNISSESKADMFAKKWKTKDLKFNPSR